uniref:Adenylate kinase n=1 Tax=Candidatus Aschnera chinzeii TaxID=1485666 RepID=A0AAT9G4W9_9ENTR|nr:MAG: adenylate kinase [Candidatus Aschnera chinzeii]
MRVILLGAPGAGKGTHSQFIADRYNIPQISSGNILRSAILRNDKVAITIKQDMENGKLVSDEIVIKLIKDHIVKNKYEKKFLLDGFPRTIHQANAMKNIGIIIDYVLELYISNEMITDRIIGRCMHASSGRVYHIKFNPPKIPNIDDITGEQLIVRNDDRKEAIYNRLNEYHNLTIPLISYYQNEAIIGIVKYFKLNANQTIFQIRKDLINILG